jgi:cold-inducible RNA-binding protein
MSKRLCISNLAIGTTEAGLMQAFAAWGASSVILPMQYGDRERGFAFIEIPDDGQAILAIAAMNGKEVDGRELIVDEARPRY